MKTKIILLSFVLLTDILYCQKSTLDLGETNQKTFRINDLNITTSNALSLFFKKNNLNENYTFSKVYSNTDKRNLKHEKFQIFYKNLKIEFSTLITHSNNQGVYLVNGEIYNAENLNLNPTLSEEFCFQKAKEKSNSSKYLWEDTDQSEIVGYKKPKGELVILPIINTNEVRLAYKYDIYSIIPIGRQEIYIDAHSGKVLFVNDIIKHANKLVSNHDLTKNFEKPEKTILVPATAETRYSGTRTLETTFNGSFYVLQDASRGNGIKTFNCQQSGYQDIDFFDLDNNWTSSEHNNQNKDNAALDAHWGAEKTYDFWDSVFDRNSFDDNGASIRSYVHYNNNFNNAFWNGSFMTYGDGNSSVQPLTSIDVCAHEIGHAICTYTANLVYQNQSGAMNEGFSDIWGACIEKHGRSGSLSGIIPSNVWLIAEDITSSAFRSMSNPLQFGDPNTYLGTNWYSGTADNGGVHTNSGVLNHWFYILTVGKSGTNNAPIPDTYNVTGIGMTKAAEIAYLAERDYLTPNSTFFDARNATIEVANSIYCANSPEVIAVTNAWYAVNVGEEYVALQDDLALQTIEEINTVSCGSSISPVIKLKNQGSNTITNVSISYTIDGGTQINETWNGNLFSCDETTFSFSISGLSRGTHLMTVTLNIPNDDKPDNNTKSVLLLINDSGTLNLVNPFTNNSDALISYNENETTPTWVRGVKPFGPLTSNGNTVYTTNLSGNYANQKKAYLLSQCYNFTSVSNPQVSFAMKFDLEENWDIIYLEYSTNLGASWNILGEMGSNWYNSNRTNASSGTANDCQNCPGAQWTGTNTTLTTYNYSLNSLIGQPNVIFRIVFHSDELENQLGINIDDFVITGVLSNSNFELNNISIYPNPSTGIFNVSLGNIAPSLIEVYDLTGKIILSKKDIVTSNSELAIDLSSASQGVYFVKIIENQNQIVKRIIKQ